MSFSEPGTWSLGPFYRPPRPLGREKGVIPHREHSSSVLPDALRQSRCVRTLLLLQVVPLVTVLVPFLGPRVNVSFRVPTLTFLSFLNKIKTSGTTKKEQKEKKKRWFKDNRLSQRHTSRGSDLQTSRHTWLGTPYLSLVRGEKPNWDSRSTSWEYGHLWQGWGYFSPSRLPVRFAPKRFCTVRSLSKDPISLSEYSSVVKYLEVPAYLRSPQTLSESTVALKGSHHFLSEVIFLLKDY